MRQQGYYWVKYEGEWHVARYRHGNPDAWTLSACIDDSWWFWDSDFEEIDERRILPPMKDIEHQPGNKS